MAEEFDFSELRNYLQGQMDLGEAELLLDEPWILEKRPGLPAAPPAPNFVPPPKPAAPVLSAAAKPDVAPVSPAAPVFNGAMPAPRAIKRTASAYESAETLDAFYSSVAGEQIYAQTNSFYRYEGPEHPKVLLLFANPVADIPSGNFVASPTGEMLARMLANLNVPAESIGVTFFFKAPQNKTFPPLVETALRKMLTKELSLIQPQVMVTCGEPLFHQIFGKGKNFEECAGTDMEFSGVKTCALVDAFAMTNDKQLKWLTWKVHIPRGTHFSA